MVDWACELDRLVSAAIHITNDTERFFEAGVESVVVKTSIVVINDLLL